MTNAMPRAGLGHSLRLQVRSIGALLMREVLTRYGRHNIGFLWIFLEPMLLTLGVTLLWHYTFSSHAGSLSVTAFAVTGYSSVQLWRTTAARCMHALQPNLSLLYHRNVRILDIYLARIVLELAGATAGFMLMIVIFVAAGLMAMPQDWYTLMLGWFLLAWFGSALALVLGAASELSELVERVWHPLSYLLFPLSGAMFLVDWLPTRLHSLALWVPMITPLELIRKGYFGSAVRAHYDIPWLLAVNLLLTLAGLYLCRRASARVEHE
ncbi:ABC transporter permease [Paraburkholderia bonniea]|uniref:ABC transporter permease n=1 Tax=Paraburkholderia bonniea TaxID=2152891 RepID=UPI001FE881FD|nr:ABC transporter permease [Paraburkholderia bonniea]WJF90811.1 ABC transporter permease [Paraburkholderia bonniea]WJF94125.1 ABC transporter permease [Paraburkholderia bonniea]